MEVWSETGRRRLKIWIIEILGSFEFLIFFVGGTSVELQSGETSTRRQSTEYAGKEHHVE